MKANKMFNLNFQKGNNKRGFTLIEMMVSVAIFSIVVMISLGAILTILDANRKARTLTEVMNNLNFSVEMITRSLKTGVEPIVTAGVLEVGAIVLEEDGFKREKTSYKLSLDGDGERGYISQCISTYNAGDECSAGDWVAITSEQVDIERFDRFVVGSDTNGGTQPRTQIFIAGTVRINEKISSDFSLQTTVSQRRLNLAGSELETIE